ncbi:hypothetical protein FJZ28_00320 [Candidatus Peregrinibacteria bacterium]|nr:hypothetical protein [Candidatus Peregrinibacteria bacterium]
MGRKKSEEMTPSLVLEQETDEAVYEGILALKRHPNSYEWQALQQRVNTMSAEFYEKACIALNRLQ